MKISMNQRPRAVNIARVHVYYKYASWEDLHGGIN